MAGDESTATAKVREVMHALGFVAVEASLLCNSHFLAPVGMMNIPFGFFLGFGPTTAPS